MPSELPSYDKAFVWTWLPGTIEPVVAGRLDARGEFITFTYGQSYLARANAMALYLPELPLGRGPIEPPAGMNLASAIRDAAPDAWGRRVILNRKFGVKGDELSELDLSELTFLLESGSDRIGALDFQFSATSYEPRSASAASLDELLQSAERVEKGIPLSPQIDQALHHGSSIGGARPKALIEADHSKFVAKFSSSSDLFNVVKAEFLAMRLALKCGIDVAPVSLVQASGKDVLLIERFDRLRSDGDWQRRSMVSALTMLSLDEMQARYASYEDLAEQVRHRFTEPSATLKELFGRMLFNILVGNTDDHARNHAAFWDGSQLNLTPAYDICPQGRTGQEASQAMLIAGSDRLSRIATCLASANSFQLGEADALGLAEKQIRAIGKYWNETCEEGGLTTIDRQFLWRRQFLNPFAFTGLEGDAAILTRAAEEVWETIAG